MDGIETEEIQNHAQVKSPAASFGDAQMWIFK
jgi:hypothetical protein